VKTILLNNLTSRVSLFDLSDSSWS